MQPDQAEKDLERIHDYAWDWFNYHAGQRTSMFNYALAAAALLAAGYGALLDKHAPVAAGIGFVGAFVLFCFFRIDGRNQALVRRGEDVLRGVQRILFAQPAKGSRLAHMPEGLYFLDDPPVKDHFFRDFWAGKHRVHLRLIELVLVFAFIAGGVFALQSQPSKEVGAAVAVGKVAESLDAAADTLKDVADKLNRTR